MKVHQLSRLHGEYKKTAGTNQGSLLSSNCTTNYMVTDEVASLKIGWLGLVCAVLAIAVFFGLYWLVSFWAWYL